jgi:hypothetical protein
MRKIRTSGLMSGEGKRGDANTAQATAPFLDSTRFELFAGYFDFRGQTGALRGRRR